MDMIILEANFKDGFTIIFWNCKNKTSKDKTIL